MKTKTVQKMKKKKVVDKIVVTEKKSTSYLQQFIY